MLEIEPNTDIANWLVTKGFDVPDALGLIVTYTCPLSCQSCGVNSGPKRTERMTREEILHYIDQAATFPTIKIIAFTGGEPFLLYDDLLVAIERARGYGLMTRIITAAKWATSYEVAYEMLDKLVKVGLDEINYSYDDYHARFVTIDQIKFAYEAAKALGLRIGFAVTVDLASQVTPKTLAVALGITQEQLNQGNQVYMVNHPLVPVGRGRSVPERRLMYAEDMIAGESGKYRGGCPIARLEPSVRPGGGLQACCSVGGSKDDYLVMGNLLENSLEKVLTDGNDDLMLTWISREGPYAIADYVRSKDPTVPLRDRYVNLCHLCHEINHNSQALAVIRENAQEIAARLSIRRTLQVADKRNPHPLKVMGPAPQLDN